MHTFEGERTLFHHDGDFTEHGEIIITRRNPGKDDKAISVPLSDLKSFMADYIRGYRIARLEQASTEEILTGDIR